MKREGGKKKDGRREEEEGGERRGCKKSISNFFLEFPLCKIRGVRYQNRVIGQFKQAYDRHCENIYIFTVP